MFDINKVYSFTTLSPYFLGSKIEYAKCAISGMTLAQARKFEPVDQKWATIYPTLPAGLVNNPEAAVYFLFEGENGNSFIMANVWIDEPTIQVVEYISITANFPQSSMEDLVKIRAALNAAGYSGKYQLSHTPLTPQ